MTFAFLFTIAVLFALVLSWEAGPDRKALMLRPAGLITWFVSGNWPAKVGAALMLIGTGALLRYLLLNIDFPASGKLFAGVAIATALGVASAAIKANPKRRAVHLALGGAALGVAYLTAYSAYGFFHFIGEPQALGALFIVACGATVFAVGSRALSIAVLAMVGAFIAPAFALNNPGPVPVYGYYLLASLLVLLMVWLRGWRPLIHLSFLFSLAGGLFFGWTQKFYTPAYYPQMQPLLLLSVALHLAMPFIEGTHPANKAAEGSWLRRFDLAYFLLLPLAALALTLAIAPDAGQEGVTGLLAMGALWLLAAGAQHLRFREGAARYGGVALIFVLLASLLWLDNLPYFLIGAVVACALLALGPKLGVPEGLEGLLSSVAFASTAGYLLQALFEPMGGTPFLNAAFGRHAVLAVALAVAGLRMRSRASNMPPVFMAVAAAWFSVANARELLHLHLAALPQLAYLALLITSGAYAVFLRWRAPQMSVTLLLATGLFFTSLVGAKGFEAWAIVPLMLAGQAVFSLLAAWAGRHQAQGESVAGVARSMLPLLMLPWALAFSAGLPAPYMPVVMTLLVASALAASVQAQLLLPHDRLWPNTWSPVGFVVFAFWLFYQSLFHIERDAWAVAYELVALVYLLQTVRFMPVSNEQDARLFKLTGALAVVSVALAMLLRLVGPAGVMTVFDLNRVLLPAVMSLCLAVIGGAMAWWSTRIPSRRLWVLGTLVLAAAAVKLVFFDFDSLGQLGNILAMMGAGGVFLLVAWLAPIPPKAEPAPHTSGSEPAPKPPRVDAGSAVPTAPAKVAPSEEAPDTQPFEVSPPHEEPAAAAAMKAAPWVAAAPMAPHAPRRAARAPIAVVDEPRGRGWLWIVAGLALVVFFYHSNQERASRRTAARVAAQQSYVAEQQAAAQDAAAALANNLPVTRPAVEPVVAPAPAKVVDVCSRFAEQMPANAKVFASGASGGRLLGYGAVPSGHEMTTFDVYVDEPDRDVVLALGAYEPTIWNIRLTRTTRIAGVIVSGYHQGVLNGLNAEVPVLKAAYDDHAPCGFFFIDNSRTQAADTLVRTVLARAVDTVFVPNNGRVNMGRGTSADHAFWSPNPTPLERLRPANARLYGAAGLDALISDGALRPASAVELEAWLSRYRAAHGQAPSRLSSRLAHYSGFKAYTMLKPVELPTSLSGMNVFIVPSGMPVPNADFNLTVLSNDPPRCAGMLCDSR